MSLGKGPDILGRTSFVQPRMSVVLNLPELPVTRFRAASGPTGAPAELFRPL